MLRSVLAATVVMMGGMALPTADAGTLDDVETRGSLSCGISNGVPGFAQTNAEGVWNGFDVDFCRAIAAAVLGDPDSVNFVSLSASTRSTKLAGGDVDVIVRNTSWTVDRDVHQAWEFAGVNFHDHIGFLLPTSLGVTSASGLDGATVCYETGSLSADIVPDYFAENGMSYEGVPVTTASTMRQSFTDGSCDVAVAHVSILEALRVGMSIPTDYVVLSDTIDAVQMGPVVRQNDPQWADIVRWTLFALIAAEELGVTDENVATLAASAGTNREINRLLGTQGEIGTSLGLESDWAKDVILNVGNYGQIFDDNIGPNTTIGLSRGRNALVEDGGLMYAPPIR